MSFKEIIQNIEDQRLKAIVLKIKNEGMKKELLFSELSPYLVQLHEYNLEIFNKVIVLVINRKFK
ncbi:MAG: hypothetical protein CBC86_0000060 [Deltaproteobacteria bacterium TMED126]|jgi:uncharacterized membrane protein YcfT|nr:hypothetical protein [Deltaproteobacteria bacterium TMED126]|tara:strand:- start:5256 stop:5450 length:195 start_codon:yes stop_codon:yes gene_type:complete